MDDVKSEIMRGNKDNPVSEIKLEIEKVKKKAAQNVWMIPPKKIN